MMMMMIIIMMTREHLQVIATIMMVYKEWVQSSVTASNTGNICTHCVNRPFCLIIVRKMLYGNSDVETNCLILLFNSRLTMLLGSLLYVFIVGRKAG